MRVTMDVEFKGKPWRVIGADVQKHLAQAVVKTAFDIEAAAKRAVPVDTGALRASIHAVTKQGSHYAQARTMAKQLRPQAPMFAEVRPSGEWEAIVAVGMEYGAPVEYGSHGRSGQPYMTPAVEGARQPFLKACEQAIERGAK